MSWWSRFFGKNARELFLEFTPLNSSWRVVTWNFDGRKRIIEVHHSGGMNSVHWSDGEVEFFQGQDLLRREKTSEELRSLMNLATHSTLKMSLEANQEFMVTPVAGATTLDMQNEGRALQWIQASFGTLSRALDKLEQDPSLILTAAFFAGKVPETGEEVVRLLAFNLDIFYYLGPEGNLRVIVFNDKDQGHGTAKAPSFQQIIKVTKPQFYDEIVRLVHRLALVGELK